MGLLRRLFLVTDLGEATADTQRGIPASVFRHDSPNLDLLRALAVLFVLVPHLIEAVAPAVKRLSAVGNVGVQMFFVHTCLVLMLSLKRTQRAEGATPHFLAFYVRRAFRIYPLSIATVSLAALSGFCVLHRWELWSNLSLTMNLTGSSMAVIPLWSLPYEVQMYILLPVLFVLAERSRSVRPTIGITLLCAVLAFSQQRWHLLPRLDLIQYAGCFLPGIVAYQLSTRPRFRWSPRLWPIFLVALALLYFGLHAIFHPQRQFLLRWPICFVLGIAAPQFRQISNRLIRRGAAVIAKYSYGIYLLHAFALHISFGRLAAYPALVRAGAFVITMVAFPFVAFHLLEQPGIDVGKRLLLSLQGRERGATGEPASERLSA